MLPPPTYRRKRWICKEGNDRVVYEYFIRRNRKASNTISTTITSTTITSTTITSTTITSTTITSTTITSTTITSTTITSTTITSTTIYNDDNCHDDYNKKNSGHTDDSDASGAFPVIRSTATAIYRIEFCVLSQLMPHGDIAF